MNKICQYELNISIVLHRWSRRCKLFVKTKTEDSKSFVREIVKKLSAKPTLRIDGILCCNLVIGRSNFKVNYHT